MWVHKRIQDHFVARNASYPHCQHRNVNSTESGLLVVKGRVWMESTSPTRLLLQRVVKGQSPHSHLPHRHLSTLTDVFLVVLSTLYRLGDAFSDSLTCVKHRNEPLKESHREKRRATCHSSFPIFLLTTAKETCCCKHCLTLFRGECGVQATTDWAPQGHRPRRTCCF